MAVKTADENSTTPRTSALWKGMPARMKVLYITTSQRTGDWLAEAFATDSATEVLLEEAVGQAAGLARLGDEVFDAVLVGHEPGDIDALDLIEGYRAGGAMEPIVVLGQSSEEEMAVLCYEVGADGYVCVPTTTTRNLIWVVVRAVQRHLLIHENQRLRQAEETRLQREQAEAHRLLEEQWALVEMAEGSAPKAESPAAASEAAPTIDATLPPELIAHYRELLRIYVIMGSGNLSPDLRRLAELLVTAGLSARQTMRLHVQVVADLVHGLGARSTRHVMSRADLLVLEVMMYLTDGYRRLYRELLCRPVQRLLPGFE